MEDSVWLPAGHEVGVVGVTYAAKRGAWKRIKRASDQVPEAFKQQGAHAHHLPLWALKVQATQLDGTPTQRLQEA